jgi:hypothetical protein
MRVNRRVLHGVARGVGAVAVAALAVGAFIAADSFERPGVRIDPPSVVVEPQESSQVRVCSGPLLVLADDAADATTASSFGSTSVVTTADPTDAPIEETGLDAPGNPDAATDGTPLVVASEPGSVVAGMLAAAQSQTASSEEISGFAASACIEPTAEAWLVGGATDVGRSSLVLLANPGDVASTVDVRVIGEAGPIEAPSAIGITVPARSQRVLSLAGLAPNVVSPVVHVTSTGGPIAASLEHTIVRGLDPSGVELVTPVAAPAPEQVIPGFVVTSAGGVAPQEDEAAGDEFPAVRLLAPGDAGVEVNVTVRSDSGEAVSELSVSLQGGRVIDVPLGNLQTGSYTVLLDADGPVVGAARATAEVEGDGGPVPADLAWTAATAPLLDRAAIAVAPGPSPTLHLANPGGDPVDVTLTLDGAERTITVAGGAATSIAVDPRSSVLVADGAGLHASVSYRGDGELASLSVQPPGPLDAPIRVYPH